MNWNARLRDARLKIGMTKSELAKQARVSPPTVTDWESGEIKKIDAENLLRVCAALHVTPQWIMFGVTEDANERKMSFVVARAFSRINDPAQREAIITQLKAFGALGNDEIGAI